MRLVNCGLPEIAFSGLHQDFYLEEDIQKFGFQGSFLSLFTFPKNKFRSVGRLKLHYLQIQNTKIESYV